MKLKFNLETDCSCKTLITNTTSLSGTDGYLMPSSNDDFATNKFIKSESTCIVKLKKVTVKGEEPLSKYTILKNSLGIIENIPDGWYHLEAILLPNLSYLRKIKSSWETSFYYLNNEDKLYSYNPKLKAEDYVGEEITTTNPLEALFASLESLGKQEFENKFFAFGYIKDYVTICNLRKCYINLCNQIFKDLCGNICITKENIDKNLSVKRDLVKMAIDTIKWLVECNRLEEANRIIKQITNCNGICNESKNLSGDRRGCGCTPKLKKGVYFGF